MGYIIGDEDLVGNMLFSILFFNGLHSLLIITDKSAYAFFLGFVILVYLSYMIGMRIGSVIGSYLKRIRAYLKRIVGRWI